MPKPVTYDHLKSKKKPVRKHCWISLDSEVGDEHARVQQRAEALRIRHKARPDDQSIVEDLAKVEEELSVLDKKMKESSVKFVFKSLGRRKYDDLVTDNQPTPEQVAEVKKEDPEATLDYDPDKFPEALVSACIVEPQLTASDVHEMFHDSENWNGSELLVLFQTALSANISRGLVSLGNG